MYNKDYYEKNKERFLEWQRVYRLKNKDIVKQKRREYNKKNHDKILQKRNEWRQNNKDKVKEQKKKDDRKYNETHKDQITQRKKIYQKSFYQKNKEKISQYNKVHSQLPHVKARRRLMERLRNKNNPRSNRSLPLDIQLAMNRVRLRDGNRCKWQGCVMTHKTSRIDVHHIFPRSEHPELELEERLMICYCVTHHAYWHMMRGDNYYKMINPDLEQLEDVSGRD